jgi:hypothetical protein
VLGVTDRVVSDGRDVAARSSAALLPTWPRSVRTNRGGIGRLALDAFDSQICVECHFAFSFNLACPIVYPA